MPPRSCSRANIALVSPMRACGVQIGGVRKGFNRSVCAHRERLATMLQVISALKGFAIEATDGRIGTVVDFLFDDVSWKVRWLVVDCGTWLKGRKVLIHPPAVSYAGLEDEQFDVKLTKAQVESSPSWQEHQPVSQQMQTSAIRPLWLGSRLGRRLSRRRAGRDGVADDGAALPWSPNELRASAPKSRTTRRATPIFAASSR